MYIDMVGYTALGQRDEELSLAAVEAQRSLLEPVLARHSGRKVKTMGDAFLVEFSNALEAARCAYDVQRATREFNKALPIEKRLHLRVGIHLGDVVESQGDILGDAVNVASRIEPLADDGGVCLTQQVYDHVHNKLDLRLVSLGKKILKNVSEQVEVYKMLMPWDEEKRISSERYEKMRIAVLPFTNMSPDPADEYFADGMTEELITTMSRLPGLQVLARTSVANYKGGAKLSTIAEELRVGTVLEGSVRKSGNRVRITAQLIDIPTEAHVWSERYDREFDDIFRIQDDIAEKIVDALRLRFATPQGPVQKRVENIEAYTLYLKGRFMWNKRSREGVLAAIEIFHEAVKVDPEYAQAWSGLADAYSLAFFNDFMSEEEARSKAREAVVKALELDDKLAEAHASLGIMLLGELKFEKAQKEFKRAIELNPNYAPAHHWYSNCLVDLGRIRDSTDEIEKAHELDPLSPATAARIGENFIYLGKIDEGISTFDKLTKIDPLYSRTYLFRAVAFMIKNMKEKALADLEASYKLNPDEYLYKGSLAWFHAWFGDIEKAQRLEQELLQNVERSQFNALYFALYYAILGKADEFFTWIEKAIARKNISVSFIRYTPFCDKVRNDPRFPEIFQKLGLPY